MIDTCPPCPDQTSSWNEAKPGLEPLPLDPRVPQGHLIHIAEPSGIFRSVSNGIEPRIPLDVRQSDPSSLYRTDQARTHQEIKLRIKTFLIRGVAPSTLTRTTHIRVLSEPGPSSVRPGSSQPPTLPSEQS